MITTSEPRVTYIDLQWPTVTLRWPILTLQTSSYLYLPHLVHTGLYHGDLETSGWVVVATKFNVKHQGKVYNHPPSTNDLWVTFLGRPFALPFPWASQLEILLDLKFYTYICFALQFPVLVAEIQSDTPCWLGTCWEPAYTVQDTSYYSA